MAVSKNGASGLFTGKVGSNYYYVRFGKQEMRAAPHIVKPKSKNQLAVMQRMGILIPIIQKLKLYIRVGYQLEGIKKADSANNCARSYNLKNAFKGQYPNQEIDYPALRLSEGNLAMPLNPLVQSTNDGLKFTWDYNPLDTTGSAYDRTLLMAWFPEQELFCQMISGVQRQKCEEILSIPPGLMGEFAETYIAFITDDRSSISKSVYTGSLSA